MENLDQLLLQAHQKLRFPKHSQPPRRGEYDSLSVGYSHGQGQLHPMNFAVSKHNRPILQGLLESPEIIRVARFMDRNLELYFPKVHRLLTNLTEILLGIEGLHLNRVFKDCCYAASQLNFSRAATDPHLDFMNAFFLCCGVWNGGRFDYKRGGQFIMWSLGLVVEFPPGAGILVPSASVTHANVPIGPEEHRHSVTFFTAAGILRWYCNGFMNDNEFLAQASKVQRENWEKYRADLWRFGLDILRDD
ncbi:hypothetical protein F5879DRAFT_812994 [Lentinula edodes]|uniref:Uncharacterized protein n=1 Tax=Lentinula lateritia TaxID=40482 RepID=A0A9W9DLA9_9AGAR|nr:hypothetical protein F5879DRAFT_812994 [Lentinula edodes]KAJ4475897.1 hypothetical protein C8J55DRAFT_431864 [Lentinula edodes]